MRKTFQDFTDSGSGYATEVVYLLHSGASLTAPKTVAEYAGVEELLVGYYDIGTDTLLKVEVLDDDGTNWREMKSYSTVGVYAPLELLGVRGIRVRALSQGNADTASALIAWR